MFDKRCAYCGCILIDESGKHMHVEHLEPIQRTREWIRGHWDSDKPRPKTEDDWNKPEFAKWVKEHYKSTGCYSPKNENEKNLFPACPNCNIDKSSQPLESYRNSLKDRKRQLQRQSLYRSAVRYGMIQEIEWDGVFWFEKYQKDVTQHEM